MLKILFLVLVFLVLSGAWIRRHYTVESAHDEVHYAVTDDGVRIAMYRYRADASDDPKAPVVLCHGYSERRFAFELPGRSMSRYLAARGHDVFVIELRGPGGSAWKADGTPIDPRFTIDDHAFSDVPAVIAKVRAITGADRVDWVGHSMGGMVIYANLAKNGALPGLGRVVTLGSPGMFGGEWKAFRWLTRIAPLLAWQKRLYLGPLITLGLFFSEIGLLRLRFIANPKNLTGRWFMLYLVNALGDASNRLTGHFASCVRAGRFVLTDGFDVQANLANIKAPVLVVGGGRDTLVAPALIEHVYQRLGSAEKKLLIASTKNGHAISYGHGDLTIGDHAEGDIWPRIAEWLAR